MSTFLSCWKYYCLLLETLVIMYYRWKKQTERNYHTSQILYRSTWKYSTYFKIILVSFFLKLFHNVYHCFYHTCIQYSTSKRQSHKHLFRNKLHVSYDNSSSTIATNLLQPNVYTENWQHHMLHWMDSTRPEQHVKWSSNIIMK